MGSAKNFLFGIHNAFYASIIILLIAGIFSFIRGRDTRKQNSRVNLKPNSANRLMLHYSGSRFGGIAWAKTNSEYFFRSTLSKPKLQTTNTTTNSKPLFWNAKNLGYDAVWLDDHLMYNNWPILESWTTLAALSSLTSRIRLGTMVSCNQHRNPALLAKTAATLDVLSNGRLEFGIGAGIQEVEHTAYGFGFPKPSVRIGTFGRSFRSDNKAVDAGKSNLPRTNITLSKMPFANQSPCRSPIHL